RAIRALLQVAQVFILMALVFLPAGIPAAEVVTGIFFFLVGVFFQSSIAVGSVYLLNYVPPAQKESYLTLAYATDGLIGGGATFLAGARLQFLEVYPIAPLGLGSYETLFALCAAIIVT